MSLICSVDYTVALQYKNMSLSTKYNNRKHKVYLKVLCNEFSLELAQALARESKNILMVEYQGLQSSQAFLEYKPNGSYVGYVTEVGNNISEEEVRELHTDTPAGMTLVLRLPNDFTNLELLSDLSQVFPDVRFCGGCLFPVEGIKVGAIGVDILEKANIKFDESSYILDRTDDVLENVPIEILTIETSVATGKKASTKKAPGEKKPAKKPSISYASLMMTGEAVGP